jgi:hypothetical protein
MPGPATGALTAGVFVPPIYWLGSGPFKSEPRPYEKRNQEQILHFVQDDN